MKIKEILDLARNKLEKAGCPDSRLEAEVLLSSVLHNNKEYLYAHLDEKISLWQNFIFQRMIKKKLNGYSSAVLTGHKWFYGLDFMVNKRVLIPRPETELIIEEVLKEVRSKKLEVRNIIDIGTGSGCVIVSIAKNLPDGTIKFWGLDISRRALRVAHKNARRNGLENRIHFLYSDLLNNIDKSIFNSPAIITANLPYLTSTQIKNSLTIQQEPKIALLSGIDGLDHYRRLFAQIREYSGIIKDKLYILCEIDEAQKTGMEKLITQILPAAKFAIKKDLAGFDRLVIVELSKLPTN
jgi:release factor glutamine methyltransferase